MSFKGISHVVKFIFENEVANLLSFTRSEFTLTEDQDTIVNVTSDGNEYKVTSTYALKDEPALDLKAIVDKAVDEAGLSVVVKEVVEPVITQVEEVVKPTSKKK